MHVAHPPPPLVCCSSSPPARLHCAPLVPPFLPPHSHISLPLCFHSLIPTCLSPFIPACLSPFVPACLSPFVSAPSFPRVPPPSFPFPHSHMSLPLCSHSLIPACPPSFLHVSLPLCLFPYSRMSLLFIPAIPAPSLSVVQVIYKKTIVSSKINQMQTKIRNLQPKRRPRRLLGPVLLVPPLLIPPLLVPPLPVPPFPVPPLLIPNSHSCCSSLPHIRVVSPSSLHVPSPPHPSMFHPPLVSRHSSLCCCFAVLFGLVAHSGGSWCWGSGCVDRHRGFEAVASL